MEKKARVLVVDDEELLVNFIVEILKMIGYEAIVCSNPVEALEAFNNNSGQEFDLLITDFRMSPWNGLELVRRMKIDGFSKPYIIVTGSADLRFPGENVLYKPFEIPLFCQTVKSLVGE
ncbi:MAG: response regulator [bacterium]